MFRCFTIVDLSFCQEEFVLASVFLRMPLRLSSWLGAISRNRQAEEARRKGQLMRILVSIWSSNGFSLLTTCGPSPILSRVCQLTMHAFYRLWTVNANPVYNIHVPSYSTLRTSMYVVGVLIALNMCKSEVHGLAGLLTLHNSSRFQGTSVLCICQAALAYCWAREWKICTLWIDAICAEKRSIDTPFFLLDHSQLWQMCCFVVCDVSFSFLLVARKLVDSTFQLVRSKR